MYGIYANIWGILMVLNVTIYSIHGSYGGITISGQTQWIRDELSGSSTKVLQCRDEEVGHPAVLLLVHLYHPGHSVAWPQDGCVK